MIKKFVNDIEKVIRPTQLRNLNNFNVFESCTNIKTFTSKFAYRNKVPPEICKIHNSFLFYFHRFELFLKHSNTIFLLKKF